MTQGDAVGGEDDPDVRDEFGSTPLIAAAAAGDLELVEVLLARGANPDAQAGDGRTPLHAAVESEGGESLAVVARLIAAGADLHVVGMNGWTPLHLAAARGFEPKARLLLDAGAEVDRRATIDGEETPLQEAARAGRPEAIPLLLERGADPFLRDLMMRRDARQIAEDAGRGCDRGVYAMLRDNPVMLDVDDLVDRVDVDAEGKAWLRESLENYDAAESYRENADRLAREGRHAEVVRLLDRHEAGLGRCRRWLASLRRRFSAGIRRLRSRS